jgi:Tol biopolymer transport system component
MNVKPAIIPTAVAACLAVSSIPGPTRADSAAATQPNHTRVDKIVVTSNRYAPTLPPSQNNFEIYLLNPDGSGEQRLTFNNVGDAFGTLSPDGKKLVFDSNRQPDELLNTSDLYLMAADGSDQTHLIRGSSASWSPDGKNIAYHASASGTALPIKPDPGAATFDSDIFVANVDDLLERGTPPRNLTHSPDAIDDDADWSPDGDWIVHTSHAVTDNHNNSVTAEIYVRRADGTGTPIRLTTNTEEERAPVWSNDGKRIAYMCRTGSPRFEICVIDANGANNTRLTINDLPDLTPAWSPDDQRIYFHRPTPDPGTSQVRQQLWWVTADGSSEQILVPATEPTGSTLFANVGVLRIKTEP